MGRWTTARGNTFPELCSPSDFSKIGSHKSYFYYTQNPNVTQNSAILNVGAKPLQECTGHQALSYTQSRHFPQDLR